MNLTVLGIGVDRVEILHPVKRRGELSGNFSLDRVHAQALSQNRFRSGMMLDSQAFRPLEPSRGLKSSTIKDFLSSVAINVLFDSP